MANKKRPYSWNRVRAGDIISFRYKSKSSGRPLTQSVLVLNPRLPVVLKDSSKTTHLIGIKLEESNVISLKLNKKEINALETIGDFEIIDEENNLYKLNIKSQFLINEIKGIKSTAYNLVSKSLGVQGQYRTYDYITAKKSSVYLEPIRMLTDED